MKKELIELVENYVNWVGIQFEGNIDVVGDDYIDSIEDMFEEAKIPTLKMIYLRLWKKSFNFSNKSMAKSMFIITHQNIQFLVMVNSRRYITNL